MKYNEELVSQYGNFAEIKTFSPPVPYKPRPDQNDYKNGYILRAFAKKINEDVITEIQPSLSRQINSTLYAVVSINWRITGPKNVVYVGGVIDNPSVAEQNRFAIDTVKTERGVDLSKVLPNPLEFWRGY